MDSEEFVKIKEWLDWHIADLKAREEHRCFNSCICACSQPDHIQIFEGIDQVAEMLGVELAVRNLDSGYREYLFGYGGVTIIQLDKINDNA